MVYLNSYYHITDLSFFRHQFRKFLRVNGAKQILVPPCHSFLNSQSEKYVQMDKTFLKMFLCFTFLLTYPIVSSSLKRKTLFELMFGRAFGTSLCTLLPSKAKNNLSKALQRYELNESVFVKKNGKHERRMAAKNVKLLGSVGDLLKRNDSTCANAMLTIYIVTER